MNTPSRSYTDELTGPGELLKEDLAPADARSFTVTGLVNARTYTFRVIATNRKGDSTPSAASNEVTPSTIPGLPILDELILNQIP